jgi:hypothetical protein
MKTVSQAITMTLGGDVHHAVRPSGNSRKWRSHDIAGSVCFAQDMPNGILLSRTAEAEKNEARGRAGASIVGMWNFQLVSEGNTAHHPSIPDGAVIDFGYSQWHSDGTKILNSGGRAPATENFCLGVWGKTGHLAFELNHFALSYDAVTGMLNAKANIREQVTLSPSGDLYSGTFTIDVYDPKENHVDHVAEPLLDSESPWIRHSLDQATGSMEQSTTYCVSVR